MFVAAMIHYFYLVGFAWMLFEGVYLYLMGVKVFNTAIRLRLFYGVAWGKYQSKSLPTENGPLVDLVKRS